MAPRQPVIITIDGPAGTGKSTAAHGLARSLGLDYLDTGAMYRAAALMALRRGLDPEDGPAIAAALRQQPLRFDWDGDPPRMMLGEEDVSGEIRTLVVSAVVSAVAAQPPVRAVLVEQQQRIAREHPRLVSEGRDQGSVVFPDAPLRFFLHADEAVRVERRARQLVSAGAEVDPQQVVDDLRQRDRLDTGRAEAPLVRPAGAIEIDTGELRAEEVIALMASISRDRLPDAGFDGPDP
jgi:cytidylate kinase